MNESLCDGCGGSVEVCSTVYLDTKLEKRPEAHIFLSNRASWDESLEEIKKFERLPE